jgi:hypothetical protein
LFEKTSPAIVLNATSFAVAAFGGEGTGARPVRDLVAERGLMNAEEFDELVLRAARDGVVAG